ncbi:MAG: restriction endonuclease, partial [Bacteroidales bacterium]|nr:restriction endonuclease [Bacteroidales bacterium]
MVSKLEELISYEKDFAHFFTEIIPSEKLAEIHKYKFKYINGAIYRMYAEASRKISTLETMEERIAHKISFFESLRVYLSHFPKESRDLIERLEKSLDEEAKPVNIENGIDAKKTKQPNFDLMDGHKFERFCVGLLKSNGFEKVKKTSGSGDFGVDILAERDGVTYAIQCKRYSSNIGNSAIQEIFSGKEFYKCHVGAVLTNQYFTSAAKETAKRTGIVLWDRDRLNAMAAQSERGVENVDVLVNKDSPDTATQQTANDN